LKQQNSIQPLEATTSISSSANQLNAASVDNQASIDNLEGVFDLLPRGTLSVTITAANQIENTQHQLSYIDTALTNTHSAPDKLPTVLLLHGNPTWSFYYRHLAAELMTTHRVIVPDLLGMGLSSRSEATFSPLDQVAALEQLVRSLQITELSLVLHDWGGPIGTVLAGRILSTKNSDDSYRGEIKNICYLNTILGDPKKLLPGWLQAISRSPLGRLFTEKYNGFINLMLYFGVGKKLSNSVRSGYLAPYRTAESRKGVGDFVGAIPLSSSSPNYQAFQELAESLKLILQMRVPIRAIWGMRDPVFRKQCLTDLLEHFPGAKVTEIADAGHLVLEHSPQIVINEIKQFLGVAV
jgi:cis-3-alkyl-4-acyloxetan-2-one decarboxylase